MQTRSEQLITSWPVSTQMQQLEIGTDSFGVLMECWGVLTVLYKLITRVFCAEDIISAKKF